MDSKTTLFSLFKLFEIEIGFFLIIDYILLLQMAVLIYFCHTFLNNQESASIFASLFS